jgi:hypothetical protein
MAKTVGNSKPKKLGYGATNCYWFSARPFVGEWEIDGRLSWDIN